MSPLWARGEYDPLGNTGLLPLQRSKLAAAHWAIWANARNAAAGCTGPAGRVVARGSVVWAVGAAGIVVLNSTQRVAWRQPYVCLLSLLLLLLL